jgi:hypothetical protein
MAAHYSAASDPDAYRPSDPDALRDGLRAGHAAAWRKAEAARLAIMGQHAGTAEGVRLLIQHDPGHKHAASILEAMAR